MTKTPNDQFIPGMVVGLQRSNSDQCVQDQPDLPSGLTPKGRELKRLQVGLATPEGGSGLLRAPTRSSRLKPAQQKVGPQEKEKWSPKEPISIPDPPVSKDPSDFSMMRTVT